MSGRSTKGSPARSPLTEALETLGDTIEALSLAAEDADTPPLAQTIRNLAVDLKNCRRRLGHLQAIAGARRAREPTVMVPPPRGVVRSGRPR